MPAPTDPTRLLPPAARAELGRYPLTDTERAPHEDGPLGPVAGWYYCGAGCGLLALALHELTGLPLVGVLRALGDRGAGDLPLELMLEAGVARDGHVLCALRLVRSRRGPRAPRRREPRAGARALPRGRRRRPR